MRYYFFIIILLLPLSLFSQKRITLSGYISDKHTTEKLPGASVKIEKQNKGVSANN